MFKNKTIDHTTVNESGEIISDALIEIDNILFDQVDIDQLFYEHCIYTHNYNGSGPDTKEKFYGNLGCNGTVEFRFSTPFYMWLLENM